jgi:hypothetical protein
MCAFVPNVRSICVRVGALLCTLFCASAIPGFADDNARDGKTEQPANSVSAQIQRQRIPLCETREVPDQRRQLFQRSMRQHPD